jgi:hypothetical protein
VNFTILWKNNFLWSQAMIKSAIMVEKDQLKLDIELLRYEMIQLGIKEGLTSEQTIQASKKLDQYIAKYLALL